MEKFDNLREVGIRILKERISELEERIERFESGNGSGTNFSIEMYNIAKEFLPQYKEQLRKMEEEWP